MRDDAAERERMRRRIESLWVESEPSTRGRPAKVSRDQIVSAAIEIADADGLNAVSMRAVARKLSVGTMTLYSHIPGHAELLDAMVDRVYTEFDPSKAELGWREALADYAQQIWELMRRHPWLPEVDTWRRPPLPAMMDAEETAYRSLIDTGLSAGTIVEVIAIVDQLVQGYARAAVAEDASRADDVDYETFWAMTVPFWENYFDPSRYPSMSRLWTSGAFDSDDAAPFVIPLRGILDIVELLIERAHREGPAEIPSLEECWRRWKEEG